MAGPLLCFILLIHSQLTAVGLAGWYSVCPGVQAQDRQQPARYTSFGNHKGVPNLVRIGGTPWLNFKGERRGVGHLGPGH